ncbi:MAG: hypothetical protein LBK07_11400, partial [Tannerella sp.]|nr:hypothetical protein [Tannerella sp.]
MHISYEQITSDSEIRGRMTIVAGKMQGDGWAARLLEKEDVALPTTAEALTVRKIQWKGKPALVVGGYDNKGLMYALLDVANRIGWSDDPSAPFRYVEDVSSAPDIKERGLAMYTMNRAYWESRFYSEDFWTQYFDMMAQNRFNMLEILFG